MRGFCKFSDKTEFSGFIDRTLERFSQKSDVPAYMKPLQTMLQEFGQNPSKEGLQKFCAEFKKFWSSRREDSFNVSREQRDKRVIAGLKEHPQLLQKFQEMNRAEAELDKFKSPREKHLEEEHRQSVRNNMLAKAIEELVRQRSHF